MGTGQICYGSIIKGILFLISEVSIVLYFVIRGWRDIVGFFTLGTQKGDAWLGIEGDNSVVMLLMGIFAWIVLGMVHAKTYGTGETPVDFPGGNRTAP